MQAPERRDWQWARRMFIHILHLSKTGMLGLDFFSAIMMPWAACENSKAKTNSIWTSAWIKDFKNVVRLPSSCKNLNVIDITTVSSFLWVSNIHISSFSLLKHHLGAFLKVILPWLLADELAVTTTSKRMKWPQNKIFKWRGIWFPFQVPFYLLREGSDVPAKMSVKAKAVSH